MGAIDVSIFITQPVSLISECTPEHLTVAAAIDQTLQQHGLFVLAPPSTSDKAIIEDLFAQGHQFFDQDEELKTALPCTSRDGFIRGYLPYGAESGRKEYFEPKEGFSYGYEWNPELPASNQLQGPNVWPAQRPDFKDACKAHFQSSVEICLAVVAAVAVALEKDPSVLLEYCHYGDTISLMRLFRYHPAVADRTCLGSSPHTDWGFLTLILQDHMGGLQVQRDDTWIDVPAPAPYSFVVNGGDFLALLSKGRYHSPVHRVQTPATKRLSFVFFYYPKYESDMQSQSWSSAASVADTGYNTLMQVEVDGVLPTFGSYIQRKWQGVQVAALK